MGDFSKSHNSLKLQQNFANFYQWMPTTMWVKKIIPLKIPLGATNVIYWLKVNGFSRKIRMGDISKSHNSLKPQQNFANFYQWTPTTMWVKKIIPLKILPGGLGNKVIYWLKVYIVCLFPFFNTFNCYKTFLRKGRGCCWYNVAIMSNKCFGKSSLVLSFLTFVYFMNSYKLTYNLKVGCSNK